MDGLYIAELQGVDIIERLKGREHQVVILVLEIVVRLVVPGLVNRKARDMDPRGCRRLWVPMTLGVFPHGILLVCLGQLAVIYSQALEQEPTPVGGTLGEDALVPLGEEGDDYYGLFEAQDHRGIVQEGEGSEERYHVEQDGRDLQGVGNLEKAHDGILLQVGTGVGLDVGEALEVVLEGIELEGGEAALCELACLR